MTSSMNSSNPAGVSPGTGEFGSSPDSVRPDNVRPSSDTPLGHRVGARHDPKARHGNPSSSNGLFKIIRQPFNQVGLAGIIYFFWSLNDLALMQEVPGVTDADLTLAALARFVAVIVPTAFVVIRKSLIAAGILTALALFLALRTYSFGEHDLCVGHLSYAAVFAYGAWAAWRRRKHQS